MPSSLHQVRGLPGASTVNSAWRFVSFYRSHGLRATMARFGEAARRLSHCGRMALFSCALPIERPTVAPGVIVERTEIADLTKAEHERIFAGWNPALRERRIAQRLAAGSELWLARVDGVLAGHGWTIQGRTIEPHFFALLADEVHLYDFRVFDGFRGRGINVALTMEILARLGERGVRRAHIECAVWNSAQLRSLDKTAFRRDADATKITLRGRPLVWRH